MEKKYFEQLQQATSDEITPGLNGELVRLAQLAGDSGTTETERQMIASTLEQKAAELGLPASTVAATVEEIRNRSAVRQYLASIGRKGGQSTSEAKRAAARRNGQRPKKQT